MTVLTNSEDFEKIISKGITLIDFYADWCGPCKMLMPILEDIDFVNVVKVNVDNFPDIATKLGIMSIPTLCFYKDGELKERLIGFKTLDEITTEYEKIAN